MLLRSTHFLSVNVENDPYGSFSEQGRRDSNPQPPVLETGALPIAPLPYCDFKSHSEQSIICRKLSILQCELHSLNYFNWNYCEAQNFSAKYRAKCLSSHQFSNLHFALKLHHSQHFSNDNFPQSFSRNLAKRFSNFSANKYQQN